MRRMILIFRMIKLDQVSLHRKRWLSPRHIYLNMQLDKTNVRNSCGKKFRLYARRNMKLKDLRKF